MNTTIENNKLIAEFMGAKYYGASQEYELYGIIDCIEDGENEKHFFTPNLMKFSDSWDWLMPVVEKINNLHIQGNPEIRIGKSTEIFYSPLNTGADKQTKLFDNWNNSTIESVYQGVVKVITWINQNATQKEN